jgi:glyoxylase-like metal-dependent hydrolase (beta-lactamase superfamily II)
MNIRTLATLLTLLSTAAYAQYNLNPDLSADETVKLSPHVWYIKGFPNIGIIVGGNATLVVDTGLGPKNGAYIAQAAQKLKTGNKLYLTTTHFHPEHASGDTGVPAGTVVIRPRTQQDELNADGQAIIDVFTKRSDVNRNLLQGAKIKTADVLFDGNSYALDLGGGVSAKLLWYGAAHTRGDEVVLADPDSVLITGDVVQNKTGPAFACQECTPQKWLAVLDQMQPLNPKIILPDHSVPGDGGLLKAEDDFMRDLVTRIAALKARGVNVDDAKKQVADEFQKKYADWVNMNGIPLAVERGYADR